MVALNSSTWLAGETAYDVGESEPSDRGRVILDVLEQKKKQKVLFDLCVFCNFGLIGFLNFGLFVEWGLSSI